jgi:hypothetical protein
MKPVFNWLFWIFKVFFFFLNREGGNKRINRKTRVSFLVVIFFRGDNGYL